MLNIAKRTKKGKQRGHVNDIKIYPKKKKKKQHYCHEQR